MKNQQNLFMLGMLAYAAQRDLSTESITRNANVSQDQLLKKDGELLTSKQVGDLWQNVIRLSKDELFGLHFGESLQLSALGVVGQIIRTSATAGDALTVASTLVPLITDLFTISVTRTDSYVWVDFIPQQSDWTANMAVCQTLDLLMVFVIHELDGLVLKKIIPSGILYAAPIKNPAEYERVMRYPLSHHNELNRLVFDDSFFELPLITADYELQQLLTDKIHQLQKSVVPESLEIRVFNYLLANAYLGVVSVEAIAANFNMSARTLQRKLKDAGTNFQLIADEVRKSLALEYLQAGSFPLKEISYLLGYNELSAFNRTFKRWTGIAPGLYKKKLVNDQ